MNYQTQSDGQNNTGFPQNVNYSFTFHAQGDQTAPPNIQYSSFPYQYQSEVAVPHLNQPKPLYTESDITVPAQQNYMPAGPNIRDTMQYHPRCDTTITNCSAYSGIASNAQRYQALDAGGNTQFNYQSQQATAVPASYFQDLIETSSGHGTSHTTSTPVMSADLYGTTSVEDISPISSPDSDISDFSFVSSIQDTLSPAVQYPDKNICSGNNQPKNDMFGQKNTSPDNPTDVKPIRKEDLLLQICTHQKPSVLKHQEWDETASGQVSKNCIS